MHWQVWLVSLPHAPYLLQLSHDQANCSSHSHCSPPVEFGKHPFKESHRHSFIQTLFDKTAFISFRNKQQKFLPVVISELTTVTCGETGKGNRILLKVSLSTRMLLAIGLGRVATGMRRTTSKSTRSVAEKSLSPSYTESVAHVHYLWMN